MQQYCRCLLPGLNDNQVVAFLKSWRVFIFETNRMRMLSQICSERIIISYDLSVYVMCCEFQPNWKDLAGCRCQVGGAGVLGYIAALIFKMNSNV